MSSLKLELLCGPKFRLLLPPSLESFINSYFEEYKLEGRVLAHFMGIDNNASVGKIGIKSYLQGNDLLLIHVWMEDDTKPFLVGIVNGKITSELFICLGGIKYEDKKTKRALNEEQIEMQRKSHAPFLMRKLEEWEIKKERLLKRIRGYLNSDGTIDGRNLRKAINEEYPRICPDRGYHTIVYKLKDDGVIYLLHPKGKKRDSLYELTI